MSHLPYYNYEGIGQASKERYGYSQAVKIGDEIHCAGQGKFKCSRGWNRLSEEISTDLETEINQAFENVDVNVKNAGGKGWADVYKVQSYHCHALDDKNVELMVKTLKKWCPDHQPIWTVLGVRELGLPNMRVEIDVSAHIKRD
ncbi:MAG: hypothetical protein M1820_007481 [Bogoriella megaspora]|nr:MAG: hypothetical protein M1820_007481 [Bogoriella megaspora]